MKFKLLEVVNYPEQKRDLSIREPRRFEAMKSRIETFCREVQADRAHGSGYRKGKGIIPMLIGIERNEK